RFRRHHEAVQAERESGLRDPFPPEDFREAVCPAASDLFLRAEVRRVDFEHHAGVVVEAPYDAQVEGVIGRLDAVCPKETRALPQVLEALCPRATEALLDRPPDC